MTAGTPGEADAEARAEDDREALGADAEDVDGTVAAELRQLADWYESSANHGRGIRANEQQLCANRIRAAVVRAASGHAAAAREPEPAPGPDVCECGHHWAHHAFSDDVCAVVDCPCTRPRPVPQAAPELAAAMAESRDLRALTAEILATFGTPARPGTVRWTAKQVAAWRKRAGLPS